MINLVIVNPANILYFLLAMRSLLKVALFVLIAAGSMVGQESFTLKVDVDLVLLSVEATDASGRPVTSLNKEDFQIYEDGVLQPLRSFDPVDAPYDILLLFDCSPSTEPEWPFLIDAMNAFIQTLRPADRVAIAQFGGSYKPLHKWFSRADVPRNMKVETSDLTCSGTDFYGAVQRGLEELRTMKGRKGVVVLSDGAHASIPFQVRGSGALLRARFVDSRDDGGFQRVLRSVAGNQVPFYFVAVDTDLNPGGGAGREAGVVFNAAEIYNKQQIRSRMEQLAEASGGKIVYPHAPEEVVGLFEQMARDLGSSYGLGYSQPDSGKGKGTRRIEVRVRDRSLKIRQSRETYAAP